MYFTDVSRNYQSMFLTDFLQMGANFESLVNYLDTTDNDFCEIYGIIRWQGKRFIVGVDAPIGIPPSVKRVYGKTFDASTSSEKELYELYLEQVKANRIGLKYRLAFRNFTYHVGILQVHDLCFSAEKSMREQLVVDYMIGSQLDEADAKSGIWDRKMYWADITVSENRKERLGYE